MTWCRPIALSSLHPKQNYKGSTDVVDVIGTPAVNNRTISPDQEDSFECTGGTVDGCCDPVRTLSFPSQSSSSTYLTYARTTVELNLAEEHGS